MVVLPYDLHQTGLVLREQGKVFHQGLVARPANHELQRQTARFVLALDAFPLEENCEQVNAIIRAVRAMSSASNTNSAGKPFCGCL
jgi:hypothetical protein